MRYLDYNIMKKILITLALILISTNVSAEIFYIKITDQEALTIIKPKIDDLFNGNFKPFVKYRSYIEDTGTGDRYYKIKNVQYNNKIYNITNWVKNNYPGLTRYTFDDISQFVPNQFI